MSRQTLEAAIEANPDDKQAWSVYGDLLSSEGDPRGELITVGLTTGAEETLYAKHRDTLVGNLARWEKTLDGEDEPGFHWHLGFLRGVRLSWDYYADQARGRVDLAEAVREIFAHPSGRFIRELTIGLSRHDPDQIYQPILDAIAAAKPPCLESLFVGDYRYPDQTEISWTEIGDVGAVLAAAPRLRELRVQGGGIALSQVSPSLRSLTMHAGGLPGATVRAIGEGSWPKLEQLTLWLGEDEYGGDATLEDLNGIFEGRNFPSLRELGLANSMFTGQIAQALRSAPILPRLERVDLSKGTLDDEEAQVLLAGSLRHLRELNLADNFLAESVGALQALGNVVGLDDQRDAEEYDGERYCSVAE
jgi:uncharacterized protein (TIGR02996 family)